MSEAQRQKVDKFVNRWISRKFLVFIIATIAMFTANLTSEDWVIICGTYIGTQGAIDAIARLKGLK